MIKITVCKKSSEAGLYVVLITYSKRRGMLPQMYSGTI